MKRRMSLLMGSLVSLIAAMGGVCASAAEFAQSASIVNYDTGETFWVLPVVIKLEEEAALWTKARWKAG